MQFFQDIHFPTDNRLRLDIGLLPLADSPRLPQRLAPSPPSGFPTDDRLRGDIGLPPLGPMIHDTESGTTLSGIVAAALRNVATAFTATLARLQIRSR
jgi:hypothetical protein